MVGLDNFRRNGWKASGRTLAIALRIFLILLFVAVTNSGFTQRLNVILDQGRWTAALAFIGVWAICLATLLAAALQPRLWARAIWGVVFALGTILGLGFRDLSGSELSVFDFLSLWSARNDAVRALDFFGAEAWWLVLVVVLTIVVVTAAPVPTHPTTRRWLSRLGWSPVLPIAAISTILLLKQGSGAAGLPTQFAPISIAAASGVVLATSPIPERAKVVWQPKAPTIRKIVLLVDESVRGDFIEWSPGNPYTPKLAALKPRIVDFGPASSAGLCSNYSNALLRFAASRNGLGRQLLVNPTIWDYAHRAGFRTVYIDAQAAFYRDPGKLVNFMTPDEARQVDGYHALTTDVAGYALDYKLLDIVAEELKSEQPVFIYANKNGAHFPYDRTYPEWQRVFRPTMTEAGRDGMTLRINSYRNAIKWAVDGFFGQLFRELDLKDTLILYTSDHAQQFDPRFVPHCGVEDPDPHTALVPLFAITEQEDLRARLSAAAHASEGHGTHFALVPTILELMGYATEDVSSRYSDSLLRPNQQPPFFTSGDIFGLFSNKVLTHPIDPKKLAGMTNHRSESMQIGSSH